MGHLIVFFWFWIGCILCGGAAAEHCDRFGMGAFLGLLWGPIGVIGALGLAPHRVSKDAAPIAPPVPPSKSEFHEPSP